MTPIQKLGLTSALLVLGAMACGGTALVKSDGDDDSQAYEQASSSTMGTACITDADCSSTTFCDVSGYGPRRCHAKHAVGAYCGDGRACKSGNCTNYVCAPATPPAPACGKTGNRCKKDADCCAGFCSNLDTGYGGYGGYGYGGYGFSSCAMPQENGASCSSDKQCASNHCDQYECKACPGSCAAVGKGCTSTADCCGSLFCNTDTYAPPTCEAPRASGAYCHDGTQCVSGNCASYVCQ